MKQNALKEILMILGLLVVFAIAIFGVSGLTKSLKNPPKLEIKGGTNFSTTEPTYTFWGSTDPKVSVTISGNKVNTDNDGNFSYTAELKDGEQTFDVMAKRNYSSSEQRVQITKIVEMPTSSQNQNTVSTNNNIVYSPIGGSSDLSASGPKEVIFGAIGLASLLMSLAIYKRSQNKQKSSYKAFTYS